MIFRILSILSIIILINSVNAVLPHFRLRGSLKKINIDTQNNIENLNFRKFLGSWNVLYTNIIKNNNLEKTKCNSFYYYLNGDYELLYKLSKKDYENNLIEKTGNIHINDLKKVNLWEIEDHNENNSDFSQIILYVDPNYKLAVISDLKKEKVDIIGRISNNPLNDEIIIEDILFENNLIPFEYFTKINHENCY
jgi:hypothetical protein